MTDSVVDLADVVPMHDQLTDYDRAHLAKYLRLLDAVAVSARWEEATCLVLDLDPAREPERARRRYETHLTRAQWLVSHGYRDLLRSGRP